MRLLVDTHVFLWMASEPERLGDARALLEDARNDLLLSAASSWEIAIKYDLGRLPLPIEPAHYVSDRLRALGVQPLAIEHTHVLAVATLPPLHRDPFDRLLAAQARVLRLRLVTADPRLADYPVETILIS